LLARVTDQYAFYLGGFRLRATLGQAPSLCGYEVDPGCLDDQFQQQPLIAHWMWRSALRAFAEERRQGSFAREAVSLDEATQAALLVYGL
jgi:hypothetical protein